MEDDEDHEPTAGLTVLLRYKRHEHSLMEFLTALSRTASNHWESTSGVIRGIQNNEASEKLV